MHGSENLGNRLSRLVQEGCMTKENKLVDCRVDDCFKVHFLAENERKTNHVYILTLQSKV